MSRREAPLDIEGLLQEAGASWRARQVFGPVKVLHNQLPKTRPKIGTFAAIVQSAVGLGALAALAIAVLLIVPLSLPDGGGDEPPGPVSTTASESPMPPTNDFASLTPSELEAAQLAIVRAVNADPYNFGGVYLTRDGVLAIQYVGDNAGRAAVDEVLMPGVPVRWEKVERSRAELDRIVASIVGRNLKGVFEIGVDTLSNQVAVLVGPGGSVSDVEKALTAEYGQAVRVEEGDLPIAPILPGPLPSP